MIVSTILDFSTCFQYHVNPAMKTEEIIFRLKQGDPIGLARAITLVENRRRDYRTILSALYPLQRKALRIGITGAPGSGKSSLVDRLLAHLKRSGKSLAVLAIDPSSPLSGGALLGDRIRMISHSTDPQIFIRSMASRGSLGGLSAAAHETIDILEAAGKEVILIETVGVGQSEIDVVNVSDLVLTVLTPTSGDEIQIFKAGLIEVTDIFVINKSDLGGADAKLREIGNYFAGTGQTPPIVAVSARGDEGIDDLVSAIDRYRTDHREVIAAKKSALSRELILRIVQERIRDEILQSPRLGRLLQAADTNNLQLTAEAIYSELCQGGIRDS